MAAGLAPSGVTLEIATLEDIPLFEGDVEANEGIPQAVIAPKSELLLLMEYCWPYARSTSSTNRMK